MDSAATERAVSDKAAVWCSAVWTDCAIAVVSEYITPCTKPDSQLQSKNQYLSWQQLAALFQKRASVLVQKDNHLC